MLYFVILCDNVMHHAKRFIKDGPKLANAEARPNARLRSAVQHVTDNDLI